MKGNVREGFTHEIKKNYDLSQTRSRPNTPIEIGFVPVNLIFDTIGDGSYTSDCVPQDELEKLLALDCGTGRES